jgi:hypothetical protein
MPPRSTAPRTVRRLLTVAAALLLTSALNEVPGVAAASTARPATAANSVIQAENYSAQSGTGTRTFPLAAGGATYVGYISNNDWTAYNNIDFGAGLQTWSATWSSAEGDSNYSGRIELHIDGLDTPAMTSLTVRYTGGWSSFTTSAATLPFPITGVHQVELLYVTSIGKNFVNIDKFQFS